MPTFKGFGAYAVELKKRSFQLPKAVRTSLRAIWERVVEIIRSKHGVRQKWRPPGDSPTPLYEFGDLQKAVAYRINEIRNRVEFYSNENWLAVIHEYGCTFRMTDAQRKYLFWVVFKNSESLGERVWKNPGYITIPARPIWRVVLEDPEVRKDATAIVGREVKYVLNQ